ncbi:hypothetical protein [Vreelandella neptunia]|uniref:Uncharacterized protein n=1 Tax=Vreelandella neptunia TaxID=115551 RepID=A0ABS9SBF5_9GAMM|nr:hypothetical protein [Halomonas neptunia]MCH4813426.1 hypothetical protein [Halomonas neptunia]
MVPKEASHTIRNASYKSPKTILGFFAIVVGILIAGTSAVIGLLSRVESLHTYIPWILLFAAFVVVTVLVGVFVTAWKDPTVLMLGQISGHDYIENKKLTLGDSNSGEYLEVQSNEELESGFSKKAAFDEPKDEEGSE